jgi:hypothetical protein
VKTTIELPGALFRKAKAVASERGVTLKDFLAEAVSDHLRRHWDSANRPNAWEKAFGGQRDLHKENKRLDSLMAEEFGKTDEEQWR